MSLFCGVIFCALSSCNHLAEEERVGCFTLVVAACIYLTGDLTGDRRHA